MGQVVTGGERWDVSVDRDWAGLAGLGHQPYTCVCSACRAFRVSRIPHYHIGSYITCRCGTCDLFRELSSFLLGAALKAGVGGDLVENMGYDSFESFWYDIEHDEREELVRAAIASLQLGGSVHAAIKILRGKA